MERGKVVAGKYRLNQPLGSGGMAEVWSATNTFTERQLAIKFMNAQVAKTPEAAARFLNEAKVSARVNHPNVIDIHDVGQTEDGQLFLVMELLTGLSLEVALRRQSPTMTQYEFCLVMIEVAQALSAAHTSGVIHRDLKPTNIFLHRIREGVAMPKLLDFGVSKFLEEDGNHALTVAGTVLGSPLYMSPEQARGESNLDGRTDVFAFGAILFEALCGYRPYEAKNFNALIVKIATTKPRSIDECAPGVPESLRLVVRACMEVDPKKRVSSFDDIVSWMKAALPELEASGARLPAPPVATTGADPDATNALPVVRSSERPPAGPVMHDTIPNGVLPGSIPPPSGSISASLPPGSVALPSYPSSGQTGPSWHTPNTSYASIAEPPPKKRGAGWFIASGVALVGLGLGVGAFATARGPAGAIATATAAATQVVAPSAHEITNPGAKSEPAPPSSDTPTISVDALPGAAKASASAPPVAKGSGRLSVNATPGWCTISVDGKERGPTPIATLDLPAGAHHVTCKPPTGKTRTASVTVQDGATSKYKFALED